MGVNTICRLPAGTRLRDVAKVAAALLGHRSYHAPISGSNTVFANVDGWKVKTASESEPALAYIVLDGNTGNPAAKAISKSDNVSYHLLYHFEGEHCGPLIMPACTPAKIAFCVGLVKFFGGTVDFNDCDAKDVNLRVKRKTDIHASDGAEWDSFQNRILAVKPITKEDIRKYEVYER